MPIDFTVATIIGSATTAIAAISGWFSKQGVDAYLKYKADKREDAKLTDAREDVLSEKEDNTLRYIIGIQQGELTALRVELKEMQANHRTELRALHDAHNACEKSQAELRTELRVRMEFMNKRVDQVEAKSGDPKVILEVHESEAIDKAVEATHKDIRQAVHDIRNDLSTASLNAQLREEQEKRG